MARNPSYKSINNKFREVNRKLIEILYAASTVEINEFNISSQTGAILTVLRSFDELDDYMCRLHQDLMQAGIIEAS